MSWFSKIVALQPGVPIPKLEPVPSSLYRLAMKQAADAAYITGNPLLLHTIPLKTFVVCDAEYNWDTMPIGFLEYAKLHGEIYDAGCRGRNDKYLNTPEGQYD